VNRERYREALVGDPSLATELADHLVRKGVPFREAHERVAELMAELEQGERDLTEISDQELAALDPSITREVLASLLDPTEAARRRRSQGGTAPEEQARQVRLLRASLNDTQKSQNRDRVGT
jgi:argininosuccinate lyase